MLPRKKIKKKGYKTKTKYVTSVISKASGQQQTTSGQVLGESEYVSLELLLHGDRCFYSPPFFSCIPSPHVQPSPLSTSETRMVHLLQWVKLC